jgi:small basic protein (TIGR04137 family)
MSQHPTLKKSGSVGTKRSVLKRFERVKTLKKRRKALRTSNLFRVSLKIRTVVLRRSIPLVPERLAPPLQAAYRRHSSHATNGGDAMTPRSPYLASQLDRSL